MTRRLFNAEEREFLERQLFEAEPPVADEGNAEQSLACRLLERWLEPLGGRMGVSGHPTHRALKAKFLELKEHQEKLRQKLSELLSPPFHTAVYIGRAEMAGRPAALVSQGQNHRVVSYAEPEIAASLLVGDQVFLGENMNILVAKASHPLPDSGETAVFKRKLSQSRIVLESREEEVVVQAAGNLPMEDLKTGDLVLWDRSLWLAYEKLSRPSGKDLFLEVTPSETFANIGGLDGPIDELQRSILLHRDHPDLVDRYGLTPMRGVLLAGPPGTGKTMLARALANWLASLSGSGKAHFMNIKPAGLHSMWYSKAEERYRQAFAAARRAGERDPSIPVVMFFDEIDSIAGTRGATFSGTNDRILSAFLSELDGLGGRGNILVVGATNRLPALDSAVTRPGRLGDLILEIPRPGRAAAGEIFDRHVPAATPFASGEDGFGESGRRATIEAALARIYSRNGHGDLATVVLRDGKRRVLRGNDLLSGAGIAKIVREATERACLRELDGGAAGLRLDDFCDAIENEFERTTNMLTPGNCRNYVTDLPLDVDVVNIEKPKRVVARSYRVLDVA